MPTEQYLGTHFILNLLMLAREYDAFLLHVGPDSRV